MKKGPLPVIYDRTNNQRISQIDFGAVRPGFQSQEFIVWLWNKRDFSDAPTMTDVRVNILPVNSYGQSVIDEDAVKIKSNGILDPDSMGIADDSETPFYTIGGELTDSDTFHEIGDIPSNCARRLVLKLDLPPDFAICGWPSLKLQVGFMSDDVQWLYVSEDR